MVGSSQICHLAYVITNMASRSKSNTSRSTCLAPSRNGGENSKNYGEAGKTSCVKVVIRVRPFNQAELAKGSSQCVRAMDDHVLVFDPNEEGESVGFLPMNRNGRKINHSINVVQRRARDLRFIFDRVLNRNASNQEVFEHTTQSITDGVLNGFNCTVFAYGATGAGKTFTMLGTPQTPGVVFQTMMDLYRRIHECRDEKTCDVAVSYLEVYNETIRDLLMPGKPLAVREDPTKGVCVNSLTLHKPRSAEELLGMLEFGNNNRTQHPTDANSQSSRSHAVFQVFVRQKDRTAGLQADVRLAKMSLIDLAGSERATVTTNRGARFREGANINKSLLALGNCINALAEKENKSGHIPYRDSKLTRLLKDSLGGNCQTVMIAAISPSSLSYEDTYNTLKYADRAKNIKSKLSRNVVSVDFHVHRYAKIVEDLKAEICELKSKISSGQVQLSDCADVSPARVEVKRLQSTLKSVVSERAAVIKDLIDIEAAERELLVKLHRKKQNVERLHLLGVEGETLEKASNKVQKCLSSNKSKQRHLSERKNQLEGRLQSNSEWLERIRMQMKLMPGSSRESEVMELCYSRETADLEGSQLRRKCQHFKKYANLQEKDAHNTERLVVKLLSTVRKQFLLLNAAGLATPDLCEEYSSTANLIEEGREISWEDQSARSKENLKFAALLNTNADNTLTGTPKKTPIRVRKFNTPLPADLDMTPTRILAKPKPTLNMTPTRLPASPVSQLNLEPARLPFSPQPELSMTPSRVLRSNSQPSPAGSIVGHHRLPMDATPSQGLRAACVSLSREFEAAETPVKTTIGSTPGLPGSTAGLPVDARISRSSANELEVKKTNSRISTPGHSNKSEAVAIVSVAQYSPYVLVDATQCRQQAGSSLLATPGVTSQLVVSQDFSTPAGNSTNALQQSVRKGDLKPRILTPYPKGAWLPVTESRTEESETPGPSESPRITSSSRELKSYVSTLGLSGVNPIPATPTTPVVKPPCFFQPSSKVKSKLKGFGTPLRELSINTHKNIQALHNHGLPSMFDHPDVLNKDTPGNNLPKRVESKENKRRLSNVLKRSTSSADVSGRSEKIRRHTSGLRRAISSGSMKFTASRTFAPSSSPKDSRATQPRRPRWQ